MWDNIVIDEIRSLEMWNHPFVKMGEHIIATHTLACIVIEVDDPRIHAIEAVLPGKIGESDTD